MSWDLHHAAGAEIDAYLKDGKIGPIAANFRKTGAIAMPVRVSEEEAEMETEMEAEKAHGYAAEAMDEHKQRAVNSNGSGTGHRSANDIAMIMNTEVAQDLRAHLYNEERIKPGTAAAMAAQLNSTSSCPTSQMLAEPALSVAAAAARGAERAPMMADPVLTARSDNCLNADFVCFAHSADPKHWCSFMSTPTGRR